MKALSPVFAIICIVSLLFITSCRPPLHYLPYTTGVTLYAGGGVVVDSTSMCNQGGVQIMFGVKCNDPIKRIELTVTDTVTGLVKTLFADSAGAHSYSDTINFMLATPGSYLVRLNVTTADDQRDLARYKITSIAQGSISIIRPAEGTTFTYSSQVSGMDFNGTITSPQPLSTLVLAIIDSASLTGVYNQTMNLSGTGPVYTFTGHAPSLPPGVYHMTAESNQGCYPWGAVRYRISP